MPKSRNAATTLALLGGIAVTMLMSCIVLARLMHVRFAEFPSEQLFRNGHSVGDSYVQDPVIGQIADASSAASSPPSTWSPSPPG